MTHEHEYRRISATRIRCACGDERCAHVWIDHASGIPHCSACGVPAHASPSQVEDWRACPRKWGYRRRAYDYPTPRNPWAEFGVRAHAIRENWLRHRIWTQEIARSREGQCVAAGISHWPQPGSPELLGVEIALDRVSLLGVPWTFKIDDLSRGADGLVCVGDLKTIGRLDTRKTDAQLAEDPQRIVYVVWTGITIAAEAVDALWSYCQRSPPAFAPVRVVERTADAQQRLAALHDSDVRPMLRANLLPIAELPRNLATCHRYKGSPCPYLALGCHDDLSLDAQIDALYTPDMPHTLGDALAAAASSAQLPPMPGEPAPAIQLTPALEQWVAQVTAQAGPEAGAEARRRAEAAMAQAPASAQPAQAPASAQPAQAPASAQPAQAPAVAQPAQAPAVAQPAQAPAVAQPAQAPARRGRPPKGGPDDAHEGAHEIAAAILTAAAILAKTDRVEVYSIWADLLARVK